MSSEKSDFNIEEEKRLENSMETRVQSGWNVYAIG